jgi:hypothetical protein
MFNIITEVNIWPYIVFLHIIIGLDNINNFIHKIHIFVRELLVLFRLAIGSYQVLIYCVINYWFIMIYYLCNFFNKNFFFFCFYEIIGKNYVFYDDGEVEDFRIDSA